MKENPSEEGVVSLVKMAEIIATEENFSKDTTPFNNVLRRLRIEAGLTQEQLSKMVGISPQYTGRFEKLRAYPEPEIALKIAKILDVEAQNIFPPYLEVLIRDKALAENLLEVPMSEVDRVLLTQAQNREALEADNDPVNEVRKTLLKEQVEAILESLSRREQKVLGLRFGMECGRQFTLEEISREIGVTSEAVRGIEIRALKKLRHPSRAKILEDYVEEENRYAHEAKKALENGLINAIITKDIPRAQQLLEKLEEQVNERINVSATLSIIEKMIEDHNFRPLKKSDISAYIKNIYCQSKTGSVIFTPLDVDTLDSKGKNEKTLMSRGEVIDRVASIFADMKEIIDWRTKIENTLLTR